MSEADALKAEIEYAAHVLRYGGHGGHHDDNHHDETKHHDPAVLAQTGDEALAADDDGHGHGGYSELDDSQAETFRQAIVDAKAAFNELVEDDREEYADAVEGAQRSSGERRDFLNAELADASDLYINGLSDLVDELGRQNTADNQDRYNRFVDWSGAELDAF